MKNYKTFYEKFDYPKEIVLLATKFLTNNQLEKIYLKHGDNLISEESGDLTKTDLTNYNQVLTKMKKIIDFLEEENVNIQEAISILNDEKKLKKLKNLYKEKNKKQRNYKSFFSNFKESPNLIRLAVMMVSDTYKETLYKKYGENLDDTTHKPNVTTNDTKKVSHRLIFKLNEILKFLNQKNLTEEEVKFLLEHQEKINI